MISRAIDNLNEREYIYILKVFATISIVSAHCSSITKDTNIVNNTFSFILNQIGSIGVGVFFIISGYLFYKSKYSFNLFFTKKFKSIIIPWVITGTCVYLYITLRKGGLGVFTWIKFILGDGSYLYYLSILMTFYIVFFYTKKMKFIIYLGIVSGCISILLTSLGYLIDINPYMNPFNFSAYFSVGLLIGNKDSLIKLSQVCSKYKKYLLILYIILLIVLNIYGIKSGYWGEATLIVQPVAILLIFGLSTEKIFYKKNIIEIGKNSFSIYLLHMPVAGVVSNIFNRLNLWVITLCRPFIVVFITVICIYVYKSITKKLGVSDRVNFIIGTR